MYYTDIEETRTSTVHRHRNTSVGEKGRSASISTKKTPVHKQTVIVQVIEALTSPEVLVKSSPFCLTKSVSQYLIL